MKAACISAKDKKNDIPAIGSQSLLILFRFYATCILCFCDSLFPSLPPPHRSSHRHVFTVLLKHLSASILFPFDWHCRSLQEKRTHSIFGFCCEKTLMEPSSDDQAQVVLNGGKHVMLSYNWNSQDIVSQVYKIIKDDNIPIWFDIQGDMKDNIYDR